MTYCQQRERECACARSCAIVAAYTGAVDAKLTELVEERFRLRFRSATESIENPMRFRALRRDIARLRPLLDPVPRKKHLHEPMRCALDIGRGIDVPVQDGG